MDVSESARELSVRSANLPRPEFQPSHPTMGHLSLTDFQTVIDAMATPAALGHGVDCTVMTSNLALRKLYKLDESVPANISKSAAHGPALPYRARGSDGREIAPEDLPVQKAARTGQVVDVRALEVALADGSTIFLNCHATPLFGPGGDVRGALCTLEDITEQVVADRSLEMALGTARMIAWRMDPSTGSIVKSERTAVEVMGLTDHNPVKQVDDGLDQVIGEDRNRHAEIIKRVSDHGGTYISHFRFRRPDNGQVIWLEENGIGAPDAAGRMQLAGVTMDITARKRAEEEMQRANRDLDEFAAIASHDLKEPLRMILRYGDLLERKLEGKLTTQEAQYLKYITSGANRLRLLVDAALDFARTGNVLAITEVSSLFALRGALDNLDERIQATRARILFDELPIVRADPSLLLQVFQNLIANAIKFARDRDPEVRVTAERRENEWVFSIADNGIGIAEGDLLRIFKMFARLDGDAPGTGIGLATCNKIITRHGGRIWAESTSGLGATFRFTLPM